MLCGWGVTIVVAEAGSVTLWLPRSPEGAGNADDLTDQAHGAFDRSVVVALGDAACWLAVVGVTDPRRRVATLEMKVDLITAHEPLVALEATGVVRRVGRSLSATSATVHGIGPGGERRKVGLVLATMLAGASDG
jgi:acyl-coenzyme A thioesterase PaaI-like protein